MSVAKPSLDEVFLALTGHDTRESELDEHADDHDHELETV